MKKNILLIAVSIVLGVLFTFFVLNKEDAYAKEEHLVYAFQVGAFQKEEYANEYINKLPSGVIIEENELYKVYVAIYKDIDILNKMVVYFEDKNINVYLKSIEVDEDFYDLLDNYEQVINKSNNYIYNKVNQSILNSYLESLEK